jgi:hypothetical protein
LGKVAKQRLNHFQTQTARVVGTAGDDFWYSSMKSPPYLQPVPHPARTLHENKQQKTPAKEDEVLNNSYL